MLSDEHRNDGAECQERPKRQCRLLARLAPDDRTDTNHRTKDEAKEDAGHHDARVEVAEIHPEQR